MGAVVALIRFCCLAVGASTALLALSATAQPIEQQRIEAPISRTEAGQRAWDAALSLEIEESPYVRLRTSGEVFDQDRVRQFALSAFAEERQLAMALIGDASDLTDADKRLVIAGLHDSDSIVRAFALSAVMRQGLTLQPLLLTMLTDDSAAYEEHDSSGNVVVILKHDVAMDALLNMRQLEEGPLWRLALEDATTGEDSALSSEYASPVANPATAGQRALLVLATRGKQADPDTYLYAQAVNDGFRFAAANVIARSSNTAKRLTHLGVLASDGNAHIRRVALGGLADTGIEGTAVMMALLEDADAAVLEDTLNYLDPETPGLLEALRPHLMRGLTYRPASYYLLFNSIAPGWSIGDNDEAIPSEALNPIARELNEEDFQVLRHQHYLWDRIRPDLFESFRKQQVARWLADPSVYGLPDDLRFTDPRDFPELPARLIEELQTLIREGQSHEFGSVRRLVGFLINDQVFGALGDSTQVSVLALMQEWDSLLERQDAQRINDYGERERSDRIPFEARGECRFFAARFWLEHLALGSGTGNQYEADVSQWLAAVELNKCGNQTVRLNMRSAARAEFLASHGRSLAALSAFSELSEPDQVASGLFYLFREATAETLDRVARGLIDNSDDLFFSDSRSLMLALRAGQGAADRLFSIASSSSAGARLKLLALDVLAGHYGERENDADFLFAPALVRLLSPREQDWIKTQISVAILTPPGWQERQRFEMLLLPLFSDTERLDTLRDWLARSLTDFDLLESSDGFVDVWLASGGTLNELFGEGDAATDTERCYQVLELASQLTATNPFRQKVVTLWLTPSSWIGINPDLRPTWGDDERDEPSTAQRKGCLAKAVALLVPTPDGIDRLATAVANGMPLFGLRAIDADSNLDHGLLRDVSIEAPLAADSRLRFALWNRLVNSDQLSSLPTAGYSSDTAENFEISDLLFGNAGDVSSPGEADLALRLHALANRLERDGNLDAAWRLRTDAVAMSLASDGLHGAREMRERGWARGRRTEFPLGAPAQGSIVVTNSRSPSSTAPSKFPSISWPPPSGFRVAELSELTAALKGASQQTATDAIVKSIEEADDGYEWGIFEGPPDGFVVISRMERIDNQGRPAGDGTRWITEGAARLSAESLVRDLFFQETGYFRVVVFVVSHERSVSPGPLSALPASSAGGRALPTTAGGQLFGERTVSALVYAFKRGKDAVVEPWIDGPSARQHMVASGLSSEVDQVVAGLKRSSSQTKP